MELTDTLIKKSCSQTIYNRGLEYYKQGRVHIRSREEEKITAIVDGEQIYNVQLTFSKNRLSDYFCTCPYYETMGSVCKHMVATMKQRQAELCDNGFQDENEQLSSALWTAFSHTVEKPSRLPLHFELNIQVKTTLSCDYSIGLSLCGKTLPSTEEFLDCFLSSREYLLGKKTLYNPALHTFGEKELAVLQILGEAYQNRAAGAAYYTRTEHRAKVGSSAFLRIFDLLAYVNYSIVFNRMDLGRVLIRPGNPDILIDLSAASGEINLYISNYGTSLVPDGQLFYYEDTIYRTEADWRAWFMPIYRSLAADCRTQLSFRGENAMGFATYVLPRLKGKSGVITDGIEEMVVNAQPVFQVFFDSSGSELLCTVKANYGGLSFLLPEGTAGGAKIVVRDYPAEARLLALLSDFTYSAGYYRLSGEEEIFHFMKDTLPQLETICQTVYSERFRLNGIRAESNIRGGVRYDYNVGLLEATIESDLSFEEIRGILSSVRLKKKFYRLKDGSFLDLEKNKKQLSILDKFDFDEASLQNRVKTLPKYQLLYLQALSQDTDAQGFCVSSSVLELTEQIKQVRAAIPSHLASTLRGYQKEGLHWMKQLTELGLGGILADDMGLGKTLQVLAFIQGENPKLPVLIVTPSSLTYNWLNEIRRFTPDEKALMIEGTREDRKALLKNIGDYRFVITSYPLLRRDIGSYEKLNFSYCIIDEAQNIKNPKTMNARSVKKVHADFRFALTGTPIENSLSELWSIFDFVIPGYLYGLGDFREWFEGPIMRDGDTDALEELKLKIKPFVLRRMKKDVLAELPEKIENTIFADLTPEQKKLYISYQSLAKNEALSIVSQEGGNAKMRILTLLMRLRQICCHPILFDESYQKDSGKLQLLEDLAETGVSSGHRLLIFSQFTSMLALIRQKLEKQGISCFYLDGATPAYERAELADRFNGGERSVFLISLKAGGAGLNLTGADMVIHYDPWWNPAAVDQASDRAYRIGQTRAVQVIRLATRNTIEEKILNLQERKRSLADDIITANNASFKNLSTQEILSLFD